MATTHEIKNNEGLNIELSISDYGNDHEVHVDGYCYMVVTLEDTVTSYDKKNLAHFIENTYYDEDYKCSQYIPGTYRLADFK